MALSRNGARSLVSDVRLVDAARAGDERAFEALYERHHPAILSFCRHLAGRLEDAEDAVQHTFLSAYREITGSTAKLDLKPWLFTVARNRCLSLLRARRLREAPTSSAPWTGARGAPEEPVAEAWGAEGLAEEVERREDLRALVADLGLLPEPQRAALVLSELEALSHSQIAQVLQVAPAKVRSLVFQARSSLISTREARDTSCGEIRTQLSTLRGSSLRRRTLRRHVRACAGCREFEQGVRVQRRDLALILPVTAGAGLREASVPSLLAGGAAGGGAAVTTSAAAGGAAIAGGGAAAGAGGGVLAGVAAAVAGSGVAQLAAVVALAATGSVGVAKADLAQRLGIADGGPRVERVTGAPAAGVPSQRETGDADEQPGKPAAGGEKAATKPDKGNAADRGKATAPGQLKKQAGSGGKPTPPGLAKKAEGGVPPGSARKGESNGNGNGNASAPGQAKGPGKPDSPGNGNRPAKPDPSGQAKPPADGKAPAGKADPPGQAKEPAKAEPPGQAKDPGKPK